MTSLRNLEVAVSDVRVVVSRFLIACTASGCPMGSDHRLAERRMFVPPLPAITEIAGGPIGPDDLHHYAICEVAARTLSRGKELFSYKRTLSFLYRKKREREEMHKATAPDRAIEAAVRRFPPSPRPQGERLTQQVIIERGLINPCVTTPEPRGQHVMTKRERRRARRDRRHGIRTLHKRVIG